MRAAGVGMRTGVRGGGGGGGGEGGGGGVGERSRFCIVNKQIEEKERGKKEKGEINE